jgi:hypothetical protein
MLDSQKVMIGFDVIHVITAVKDSESSTSFSSIKTDTLVLLMQFHVSVTNFLRKVFKLK